MLKRRAQEILSLADKTKRDFMQKDEMPSGTVSIGCGEYHSTKYLAKIISEFRKLHLNVDYEIYSGNSNNIHDNIEKGLLDVGVMSEPIDVHKYNFINMPIKEQWGTLVRNDLPLSKKVGIGSNNSFALEKETDILNGNRRVYRFRKRIFEIN